MRTRLVSGVLLLTAMASASRLYGQAGQTQSQPRPVTFEVASVKADTTDTPTTSRFPLGPGDAYVPGSLFSAINVPLINYIRFAFGRSQGEMLTAPSWVYIERLAAFLSNNGFSGVDRAVIDRTGLDGQFDFSLEFAIPAASAETQPTVDVGGPSLATALREQLGLKLESTRAPVDVLLIDRV